MNRALFTLLLLNNKATFRRTLRGVKSVRGVLLLLFTVGFIALMIGPQVFTALMMRDRPELRQLTAGTAPFAPLALFGFTLLFVFTSAGEAAVYFTPAEVDLLFAAPFTRRELLVYKLAKTALALLLMSAFFSLMMLTVLYSWLAGFAGIVLSLAMTQLVGMFTALIGQIVAEAVYTRTRKVALLVVVLLVMAGLAQALGRVEAQGLPGIVAGLRESPVFRVVLAPFEVFARTIYAEEWFPDLVCWGAAALAIDLGLLILVLKLDANYIESAATISQKIYERIRRSKQGGGIAMPVSSKAARLGMPQLPWLAGAGPVAWRQLLLVIRTSRHLLITSLVMVGVVTAGAFFTPVPAGVPGASSVMPVMGIGMTFYMTFIFSMQLPWAFRGDVDHIDFLKTLPLRPAILAAGELTGGVLVLTALQLMLFAMITAAAPPSWPMILAAAAFCLPLNGLLMSLNNMLFLIYPVRHPAGTTFDFQMFGKMMLFFFFQLVLLFPLVGVPAALAGIAYLLAGYSWPVFAITIWLLLSAEVPPLVLAVAWAFQRYDVSTQTPA